MMKFIGFIILVGSIWLIAAAICQKLDNKLAELKSLICHLKDELLVVEKELEEIKEHVETIRDVESRSKRDNQPI